MQLVLLAASCSVLSSEVLFLKTFLCEKKKFSATVLVAYSYSMHSVNLKFFTLNWEGSIVSINNFKLEILAGFTWRHFIQNILSWTFSHKYLKSGWILSLIIPLTKTVYFFIFFLIHSSF